MELLGLAQLLMKAMIEFLLLVVTGVIPTGNVTPVLGPHMPAADPAATAVVPAAAPVAVTFGETTAKDAAEAVALVELAPVDAATMRDATMTTGVLKPGQKSTTIRLVQIHGTIFATLSGPGTIPP